MMKKEAPKKHGEHICKEIYFFPSNGKARWWVCRNRPVLVFPNNCAQLAEIGPSQFLNQPKSVTQFSHLQHQFVPPALVPLPMTPCNPYISRGVQRWERGSIKGLQDLSI